MKMFFLAAMLALTAMSGVAVTHYTAYADGPGGGVPRGR
jgi:hypothetical protein